MYEKVKIKYPNSFGSIFLYLGIIVGYNKNNLMVSINKNILNMKLDDLDCSWLIKLKYKILMRFSKE